MYTLDMAKHEKNENIIKFFSICKSHDGDGTWYLEFRRTQKTGGYCYTLQNHRTKSPRKFKTLDAAVKCLEEIGFHVDFLDGNFNAEEN